MNNKLVKIIAILSLVGVLLSGKVKEKSQEIRKDHLLRSFDAAYRIKPQRDILFDHWQTAKETKERGKGDCEDKAIYLWSLLKEAGLESRMVIGKVNLKRGTYHVWVEYEIDGNKYILDPSLGMIIIRDKDLEQIVMYVDKGDDPIIKRKMERFMKKLAQEQGLNT